MGEGRQQGSRGQENLEHPDVRNHPEIPVLAG